MRSLAPWIVLLLLLPALPGGRASAATEILVPVDGGEAHGWIALPTAPCRGVAVVVHGIGHPASDHIAHIEHIADEGFVAVAMDFRGPVDGFPLRAGATDVEAGARYAMAACPGTPVVLYSVSLGTAVASMVLAELPVFRYWVDNEGLSMLAETWAEATAVGPANSFARNASLAIEAECGGSPAVDPACYHERSAALRAPEYAYLQGAVLTHGLNDGLVPYDQGREMATALRAVGVPTDMTTVVRGEPGGEGTTLTGYACHCLDNGFAGHGTESNDAHTLTRLSFELLDDVLLGRLVPSGQERVTDRDLGTLP